MDKAINKKYAGIHFLIDFWSGKKIEDKKEMESLLSGAAKSANNTALKTVIHKFYPQGMTGVILLAESHIAIHTWPEIDYVAIDIFTCGDKSRPEKALDYFKEKLTPKDIQIKRIKRGIL